MSTVGLLKRSQALFGSVLFTLATVAGSFAWLPATASAFAGGDGQTANTAWQIADCTQLQSLNDEFTYFDDFFEITQSFSCSGIADFDAINFGSSVNFEGQLDGKGFTISDLTIADTSSYTGLFIGIDGGAVFDLNFSNADVSNVDNTRTGILAGIAYNSAFSNITIQDSAVAVTEDSIYTGGLLGESTGSTFNTIDVEASVTADITRGSYVGGLIGRSLGDQLNNVVVQAGADLETPQVYGDLNVGGLIGFAEATGIENGTSNAFVRGRYNVGGLVGSLSVNDDSSKEITSTTTTGEVYGLENVGGSIGLAADNESAGIEFRISDSVATGQVSGFGDIGGFIGENAAAEIFESYATGDIISDQCECISQGGFVGFLTDSLNTEGYIHESFATGDVDPTASGSFSSGGFVGTVDGGRIMNAYSRGNVRAYEAAGSFAAYVTTGVLENVYSTGSVISEEDAAGGLVFDNETGTVTNSFWDMDTSGQAISEGGTGLTTAEATTITPYQDAGWDFTEAPIWGQSLSVNDGYPCLFFYEACNEAAVVNDEDLNGDEIPDVDQPNVGGYVSGFTGKTVAIDVGEGCELTVDDMIRESSFDVQDAAYEYDNGLWEFEAECAQGATTTIKLYYYDVEPAGLVLRKHNDITGAYFNVPGAVITTETINGSSVTVVTYQITDDGDLDLEKEDPGMIRDPAGLGRSFGANTVGVPNTGLRR